MFVQAINPNGAANGVLQVDDVILAVDGRTVEDLEELMEILNGYRVGDTVVLKVRRQGAEIDRQITLKAYQPDPD